ncbi:MAG: hypothetical protein GC200_00150 [Tepidisphaera sp.]|nr:hypothetical protein [Tepidisphaera sp.]
MTNYRRGWTGLACRSALVFGLFAFAGSVQVACAQTNAGDSAKAMAAKSDKPDEKNVLLIFRTGRTIEGVVTSETPTAIKVKGKVAGLDFESEYQKSEILDIKRGVKLSDAPADSGDQGDKSAPSMSESTSPPVDARGKQKYYWMDLQGNFGEEITQTPIREAITDAKRNGADIIIMRLDSDPGSAKEIKRDESDQAERFDEIFRAEQIVPIFGEEIPRDWDKKPRVAMWVRSAWSGAALMPFIVPELYFTSDGRMGGIGDLSNIFKGVGDEVVREKQRSLRLGHAEGWAIKGGYDYRLIRAMARVEYVLSVRYVNGKPELFEGYPSNPGEELLTDDGKDANEDTDQQKVSGTGNDVLTLTAPIAKKLGVSKGTVDTKEDLLVAMGIDRGAIEDSGRSQYIMKSWADGLDATKRRIRNLLEDYSRVPQGGGDYAARTQTRGRQISILNQIRGMLTGRYKEALSQRWLRENGIPSEGAINTKIEEIKINQQKDKK